MSFNLLLEVGSVIRKKRKAMKISQDELAFRMGVSACTISKWESGKGGMTIINLHEAMKVLKLTASEFDQAFSINKEVMNEY